MWSIITAAVVAVVAIYLGLIWFLSEKVPALNLAGKNVLITGGSSGIGLATAELLLKEKVSNIAIVSRKQTLLDEAKAQLEKLSATTGHQFKIFTYSADVSDYTRMCAVTQEFVTAVGSIDILIASAGVSRPALIDDIPFEEFEWMSKVNYLGVVATCKAALPFFKKQQQGRIVIIGSMAGLFGITGYSSYAPTKYAVRGFAEVLFMEMKPHNVYVSLCNPPDVDTPMYKEEMKGKPKECIEMSAGSGLFSAEKLATDIVNGIKSYKFFIQTGFDGFLLGVLTAGAMPGANFFDTFCSVTGASLARFILLFVRCDFDKIAKKCHDERAVAERKVD